MSALHTLLQGITDIGDSACLLAVTGAASIYLYNRGSARASVLLLTSFALAALFIGMLKIAFLGCHAHLYHFAIHSPSGHAANSMAVLSTVAFLMRSQLEARRRFLPLLLSASLIAAIAVTRVWLGYHSLSEIVIGLMTGTLAFYLARFLVTRGRSPGRFDAYALALCAVVAGFLLHGVHFPGEVFIRMVSSHAGGYLPYCGA